MSNLTGLPSQVGDQNGSTMTLVGFSADGRPVNADFGVSPAKSRGGQTPPAAAAGGGGSGEVASFESAPGDLVLRSALKPAHEGTRISRDLLNRGLDKDSVPSAADVGDDDDDEEADVFRINGSLQSISDKGSVLSVTTPTPVATRVQIDSIECIDLKHAHTFRKNNPIVVLECGDFASKSRKIIKGGQNCSFDKLGWVFVMRRMTFFRITVYSDNHVIGSVAVSTREILGIPKKGADTIFRRNLEFESEITGKIRIVSNVDGRYSVPEQHSHARGHPGPAKGGQEAPARAGRPAPGGAQGGDPQKPLPAPELPMTVRVTRINVVDIIPLHAVAANSPFVQISMGHFKKRTAKAFAAGASADWSDLGWMFDVVDLKATITFSVISGSKKAGALVLTVRELLQIPRSKQGYTEVSGTVWTDDRLIAGQLVVSILLTPS